MRDLDRNLLQAELVLRHQLTDTQTLAEAERGLEALGDAPPLRSEQIESWVRLATQPPGTGATRGAGARRQLLAAAAVLVVLVTGSIAWANRQSRSTADEDLRHATQFAIAVDAAAGAAQDEPQRIGALRVLLNHCGFAIETLQGLAKGDAALAEAADAALADVRAALGAGGDYRPIDDDEDLLDAAAKVTDGKLPLAERLDHLTRLRRLARCAAVGLHQLRLQTEDGMQLQRDALAMMLERCAPTVKPAGEGR